MSQLTVQLGMVRMLHIYNYTCTDYDNSSLGILCMYGRYTLNFDGSVISLTPFSCCSGTQCSYLKHKKSTQYNTDFGY